MKTDRYSVILASSSVQAVGASRGHRSLGDGENLALGSGRRSGSLHDRTNINSRGWNNSTRTSPTMKRRAQDNKENNKLPGIKKFQHVQSKLAAPVFAQRRLKHAEGADKAGAAFEGGPLQSSSDAPAPIPQADGPGYADGHQIPGKSVPFDHFVTKRCRGQQVDAQCDIDFISPRPHVHNDDCVPEQKQAEVSTNLPVVVSPLARASPHPSISALYQYAQEVRTPLSSAANASPSFGRSMDDANRLTGLKGAAHELEQARREDLTDSFGTWLASMSMKPEALPPVALEKMHALWKKAKEAVELQTLLEQLQNVELGQNDTENLELSGDSLFPANNRLEVGEATLQQQLLDAHERLACLTPPQTSPGDAQVALGAEVPSSREPVSTDLQFEACILVPAADVESAGQACSPMCSSGSVAIVAQASDRAWERSESPTAAGSTECDALGTRLDIIPSVSVDLEHAEDGSFQVLPGLQIQPCYSSTSAALATVRAELESPYSCARFAGAAPCVPADTPGLSVISRVPEAMPFATWVAGVDGTTCPAESPTVRWNPMEMESASVATPEGTMPTPGVMPSTLAADSGPTAPQSHQQSAGLSFASRMPQPVAFAMWATLGKLDQTPGAASDCHGPRSDCAGSPQQSAGLSVVSSIPQAMAFDLWASVQRAHITRSAAGNMQSSPGPCTSISPLSSVGPETVSKPEHAGSWQNSAASTPFMGLGTNVGRASPATHVRCNPLFEIDSPASSISALPERADALGGLAPTPSPARMVSPPSLASTPMSAFSQALHSNLTSPVGDCSPVLFNGKAFVAADLSSSAVAAPDSFVVASCNTNICESESAVEALRADKLSGAVDNVGSTDESPVQAEACVPETATNTADGGHLSPLPSGDDLLCSESNATPEAEVPAATLVESCRASYSSPKDVLSPAAENVIATKFAASPVADCRARESACVETQPALQSANLAGVKTEAVDLQQGTSVEVTQDVPAVVLSRMASWDQVSLGPGVAAQEPPCGSCSAVGGNGSEKVPLLGEGSAHSYPNTPSAAWSPSTSTSVYATPLEAFATPTSLAASLCSAICLTAIQMRGGAAMPGGRGPESGNGTPSNFTFGLSHMQPDGCGSHLDAPTPTLGPAIPAAAGGVSKSKPGLPLGLGLPNANVGFGSPMPLMQLSPVQMRLLDQLAGHVIAVLSPASKHGAPNGLGSSPIWPTAAKEQSATSDEGCPSSDAPAAAFSLAQILSNLRSPLPAPGHQRTRFAPTAPEDTATASVIEVAPAAKIELGDMEVTSPNTTASNAQATEVSAANSVHAPSASPMPNFARLMAFLNAAGHATTAPVGVGRPSCVHGQPTAAHVPSDDNEVDGTNAAAPEFNLARLLAQLYSPLPNPGAVRSDDAVSGAGCVDSPITAHGGHDSPASSEAASFGFSTAAKQMASRITPSTTPGGVSFVRWAHDAGPPSFRLDNDAPRARGRAARTPSTPLSFSFGAPFGPMAASEEVTPVVGNGRTKDVRAAQGPSPIKLQLHQSITMAGGGQAHSRCSAAPPENCRQAINESFSFHAVAANPMISNGSTVASPAFSFGPQPGDLLGCTASSKVAFGPSAVQDRSPVESGEMYPAQSAVRFNLARQGSWSPVPSLGIWGSKPRGSDASASPLNTSGSPSERGFTFDHVVASLMATPIWPGAGTTAVAELTAERPGAGFVSDLSAAFQQFAVAVSPTLFGMATHGDPQETPGVDSRELRQVNVTAAPHDGSTGGGQGAAGGSLQEDVYTPAAAFLWATLLGNLHSPVPAAIHARQQHLGPIAPPTATSRGALPATANVSEAPSTGAISGSEEVVEAAADLGPTPPPYEDLPDLIARGLCLSASTTVQTLDDGLVSAAEPDTYGVLSEDPTPSDCSVQVLDRHFQPVHELMPAAATGVLDDSPVVSVQSPSGQMVIKSVSDSSRGSTDTLYAAPTAKTTCTAVPLQLSPTGDPQPMDGAGNVDENSSHNSPVFSFHVASEGSARSVGSAHAFLPLTATIGPAEAGSDCITTGDASARTPNDKSPVLGRCQGDDDDNQVTPARSVLPQHVKNIAPWVDAMPRLLSSAGAASTTKSAVTTAPSAAIEPSKDNSADGSSDIASVPVPSPTASKRQDVHEGLVSPLTFSYLSSSTPPSTPPTAELASSGKAGSVVGQPRASPRTSTSNSSHFWAPSPSGPSVASGDRVTLEVSNRRIRTNADLLLDFQNALAAAVVPAATGDVSKPCSKPKDSAAGYGFSATRPSAMNPSESQTACVAVGRNPAGMVQGGLRARTLQPGQGPPLQQLVATGIEQALASATAAVVQHSSGLPLSHRLGLWPAAAWGIPCNLPSDAATVLQSAVVSAPSAKAVQDLQHKEAVQPKADARSSAQHAVAPGKPVVTSRDVQTTPGLIKMHRDCEHKETVIQPSHALVDKTVQLPYDQRTGQVPGGTGAVAANRKLAYRSRIPMPGGATRVSATTKVTTQLSRASTAASSDGEESNAGMARTPPERMVRRRRLLSCSAAAGGPQRVLIKRGTQRPSAQDAADMVLGLGEEEVRRRARVLGMRISPYLRTKPSKARSAEAPKPSKG
ncbi:hypothetical protein Vretimale_13501 [Volvox reticuliferus]|uniref:Uncharacterized protein n=1 Tax=Volvox reticuliferus TaxID=1737510 RepID=A0A8J4LUB6_9CHLO|nr:hypothetical protein Vretifemale_356 [Volvox reticuliferus]GIM09695.1 hypothetical protein Vretimale_13501 [Volvox reticuliferus]